MIFLAVDIPVEVIRERGFADYIVYTLVALGIAERIWSWFRPAERKITGTIQSETVPKLVEQSALDAVTKKVDDLSEAITAQFRAAQTAGENRVMAITQDVNTEMGSLSIKIGDITKMITTALVDNAGQGEAINNLKAAVHGHQQSITAIHRRIDDEKTGHGKLINEIHQRIDGILQQSRSKRASS